MCNKGDDKIIISGLTSIRGIAACLIVCFHIWALCGFAGKNEVFDSIVSNFDSFVRLFFLMSGFAMLCGYEKRILKSEKSIKNFYIKRFFKIAPIFYFVLILQIIINYIFNNEITSISNIIMSASLLSGLLPINQELIVWASWAVVIEWIFYLIFPIYVILVKNKYSLVISFFISLIITCSYEKIIPIDVTNSHINILRYLSYFFMGGILYKLIPYIKKIHKNRILDFMEIPYIIVSIFVGIVLSNLLNRDIAMLVTFSLFICGAIYGYSKIIDNKLTRFLGKISYSIYLLHMIVVQLLSKLGIIHYIAKYVNNFFLAFLITSIITLIVTAFLSYIATIYIEEYWVVKSKKYLE